MKTVLEGLEESQPKPGQELRLESLEKIKNDERRTHEKYETLMETNAEKPIEGKKGITHSLGLWLTGQVIGKKSSGKFKINHMQN